MTAATFKQLVIDANDPVRLGRFWAGVLGLQPGEPEDGWLPLRGPEPQQTLYLQTVSEPVTVKQRVHLDVYAAGVDDVLDLGATPVDLESFRWQVLRDPEGGEMCVFKRDDVPAYRLYEVCVDSHDPPRIAQWWADLLGGTVQHHDGDDEQWSWIEGIHGAPFTAMVFDKVPEPKTVKNRIHWDVTAPDLSLLTGDGARILREPTGPDDDIRWTVLADPEGNEFCAFG